MNVPVSTQTIATALVYLSELVLYVPDVPDKLEDCMIALKEARDTNPCICGCCDGSDCGQTPRPLCYLCEAGSAGCVDCNSLGLVNVKGAMVMCRHCLGQPNQCPKCRSKKMSDDLLRAVAEGMITVLDQSRGNYYVPDVPDALEDCMITRNLRTALDAYPVCKHCNDTGRCYYQFIDGTPIVSSRGACVCTKLEPDGPPGCKCAEKTWAAEGARLYVCAHCKS